MKSNNTVKINDNVWVTLTPDLDLSQQKNLTKRDLEDMRGVVAVTPTGIVLYKNGKIQNCCEGV